MPPTRNMTGIQWEKWVLKIRLWSASMGSYLTFWGGYRDERSLGVELTPSLGMSLLKPVESALETRATQSAFGRTLSHVCILDSPFKLLLGITLQSSTSGPTSNEGGISCLGGQGQKRCRFNEGCGITQNGCQPCVGHVSRKDLLFILETPYSKYRRLKTSLFCLLSQLSHL